MYCPSFPEAPTMHTYIGNSSTGLCLPHLRGGLGGGLLWLER